MLKGRGARINSCGTSFLRRRNQLLLPFPVVRVKLRLLFLIYLYWLKATNTDITIETI